MSRRSLAVSLVLLLIGVSVGWSLSIYAQSGTPEIKPTGITGFNWVNASSFKLNDELWYGSTSSNRTDVIAYPFQEAKFIIESDGTTAKWKNTATGQIVTSGTNHANIINWALGNLTAGRSWKEEVVLKGSFLIDTQINVDDYTIIRLLGKLKQNLDNISIVNIQASHVEFYGGEIDGDKSNNPNTWIGYAGIKIYSGNDILIQGVTVHDHKNDGIQASYNSKNIRVVDCYSYNNDRNGISFQGGVSYSIMDGNVVYNNTVNGLWDSGSSIRPNYRNIISNNVVYENEYGIFVDSYTISPLVIGNTVYNNDLEGIIVNGDSTDPSGGDPVDFNTTENAAIIGNHISDNGYNGIIVQYLKNATISSNYCYNNWRDGVRLQAVFGCSVIGNKLMKNARGIREITETLAPDNNYFIANDVRYNREVGISYSGTNSKAKHNIGFVTENAGTATLLNGTTSITINHGCDYTPSAGDISVHPIESLGSASFWWVDTITATQFTIHVNADPGQDIDFAWSVDSH